MSLGLGVMISMLGGNEESVEAIKCALNKTIEAAVLKDERLQLNFTDGTAIELLDDGQSCCENRYMVIDDDLTAYRGAVFTDVSIKDAPNEQDEYGDHEVQFLEVMTSKGPITAASHNEHNGYYGGFSIVARNITTTNG